MKTTLLAAALAAAPLAASAATLVIDDFTSTQIVADRSIEPAYPSISEAAGPTVVGGFRELTVRTLNGGGVFASTLSSNASGEGRLNFSNQSNQRGVGTVLYDGEGSAGLGGLDLTFGGGTRFAFAVQNADAAMTIRSTVTDTSGASSMLERTFPGSIAGSRISFAFADFAGVADFASVDAIAFTFSGPQDLDASFDRIVVAGSPAAPVPLPAGGALLAAALLAFGALRRLRG